MAGSQPQLTANAASLPYAREPGIGVPRTLPITLQNYFQTLFWTFAAVAVCGVGYLIEKYGIFRPLGWLEEPNAVQFRMFKNPAELPMRLFGLPHFIIGLTFMISSKRMRGARSWAQFAGLLALGVVFCWLFYKYGSVPDPKTGNWTGTLNATALLAFYFYFLIHGFRDEAFFYKAYGDMPKDASASHEKLTIIFQVLMMGLLLSFLIPAYNLYGSLKPQYASPLLDQLFPADWPFLIRFLSMMLPMTLIAWLAVMRIARKFPDGVRGLWRAHRPILLVFFISTAIIVLPLWTGPWVFNVVVLMHFVGWYLFGRYSLAKRPPATPPPKYSWQWMRTTRTGFTFLHLGLAAVCVALVALSTYALGKPNGLDLVVGSKVFYYWTILHVTLSFFPR